MTSFQERMQARAILNIKHSLDLSDAIRFNSTIKYIIVLVIRNYI